MAQLQDRYGGDEDEYDEDRTYADDIAARTSSAAAASNISVLPSVKDPKLFLVKCDPGKEEESVWALMKRYLTKQNSREEKLFITSCFTTPASKGYIYIEAFRGITSCQFYLHSTHNIIQFHVYTAAIMQLSL